MIYSALFLIGLLGLVAQTLLGGAHAGPHAHAGHTGHGGHAGHAHGHHTGRGH